MGTSCIRWAGAGASDNSQGGNVAVSNPDKVIQTTMGQNLLEAANTNQAHFTLTPGDITELHKTFQFKAGVNIGKIHADATNIRLNALLHIFFAGDDSDINEDLEIYEWGPVIAGTCRYDLKESCSVFLRQATSLAFQHVVLGTRDAEGKPASDFGGLTRAQVVADNFGIWYRTRNSDGSFTNTVVCDQVACWFYYGTPDYEAVITANVDDPTGMTVSGEVPFMLMADAYDSAFKQQEMYEAHIRWRLTTPTGATRLMTTFLREGSVVSMEVVDLNLCLTGLLQAWVLDEVGVHILEQFIYEPGNVTPVATKAIAIRTGPWTGERRYVNGADGDNANTGSGPGVGEAWQTAEKAAEDAPDHCIIEFEGGNTYTRSTVNFEQENLVVRARAGTGDALFEHNGGINTCWGVFTGDRLVLDLRSIQVSDSDVGEDNLTKSIFQTTGDDILVWGASAATKIAGFHRYGNNVAIQERVFFLSCHFLDEQIVTYFYISGSDPGGVSRAVFTGCTALSATNASGNGFIRIGGPGKNNTDSATGITCNFCSIDNETNIGGDVGKAWSFRLNGSLVQMFGCAVSGSMWGNPQFFDPGSTKPLGNWGHLTERCYGRPTVSGIKVETQGHLRTIRACVLDMTDNQDEIPIWGYMTPLSVRVVNNTFLVDREHPGAIVNDARAPWYVPGQTHIINNNFIGTADNGPNAHAYGDDQLAWSFPSPGSQPTHIGAFTGNVWTANGLHPVPFTVDGVAGVLADLNTKYGGTNFVTSSVFADYPEAADFAPDADATEARAGSDIVCPVDYRGIMRVADPTYLGSTGSDASNPDLPEFAGVEDLTAESQEDRIVLGPWTPPVDNPAPQLLYRQIDDGEWVLRAVLEPDDTTFEDIEN